MKARQTDRPITYAAMIVWLHAGVVVLHGLTHVETEVGLSPFGTAFVTGIVVLAPLLALLLLHARGPRAGALLLLFSMLGALIFGLWNHFLVPGADQVAEVPPGVWHLPFLVSSILLAVLELVGTGVGGWCLYVLGRSRPRPGKP